MCTEMGVAALGSVCACCTKYVWPLRYCASGSTPSLSSPMPEMVVAKMRLSHWPSLLYWVSGRALVSMLKAAWSLILASLALATWTKGQEPR